MDIRKSHPADRNLSSWTGLGRSGHVQSQSFGLISHVSGPKLVLLTKFLDDSAWFCLEKLKTFFFRPETLIYDQSRKYPKNLQHNQKINGNIGFPRISCPGEVKCLLGLCVWMVTVPKEHVSYSEIVVEDCV